MLDNQISSVAPFFSIQPLKSGIIKYLWKDYTVLDYVNAKEI